MRKPNISRFCLLGIAAILTAGCMILSVGTAMARYRASWDQKILYTPRGNRMPVLGTQDEFGFDPDGWIGWELEETEDIATLEFAVANLNEDMEPWAEDLQFSVRIIGSLSAWEDQTDAKLVLYDGTLLEDGTPRQALAQVTPIRKGTALYRSFGDGWVFEFLDEEGKTITWTLPGGVLSTAQFQIDLEGSGTSDVSLLQLQIISEVAG